MSFLTDLHAKRAKLAEVLADDDNGILEIVSELYPDNAHFIYELLQNAEDAHATDVSFSLEDKRLTVEHNGRPFNEKDIEAITTIGKGTKKKGDDKIGRFGIGFKAVFAYTENPNIYSDKYAFRIENKVQPVEVAHKPNLGKLTYFEFPFNSDKKTPAIARLEIQRGLEELDQTTLLFLSHIRFIRWRTRDEHGAIYREDYPGNRIEILKEVNGQKTESFSYLRFSELVKGLDNQQVAIAFELKRLEQSDAKKETFKIVPAEGTVSIFFPARKETSKLNFHLHAPFVPELSRASIKETAANDPLYEQLTSLTVKSLYSLRDLGLLTKEFVEKVMPIRDDNLPKHYAPILDAIVAEMKEHPLVPIDDEAGHAAAKHLLQARTQFKSLITKEDLKVLVQWEEQPPDWAMGRERGYRGDKFLKELEIPVWDMGEMLDMHFRIMSDRIREWMSSKDAMWHQYLYSNLHFDEFKDVGSYPFIRDIEIVRTHSGSYVKGSDAYFCDGDKITDKSLDFVDPRILVGGRGRQHQERARQFLEAIGVTKVGSRDRIEIVLARNYACVNPQVNDDLYAEHHLRRFLNFIENQPDEAELFGNYYVIRVGRSKWARPCESYIDVPYQETGLAGYFRLLPKEDQKLPVHKFYDERRKTLERQRMLNFFLKVGLQRYLIPERVDCQNNPEWDYLRSVPGDREYSPINEDWQIPYLAQFLQEPTLIKAMLLWNTLNDLENRYEYSHLTARCQKSRRHGCHEAPSQLMCLVTQLDWVPQTDGRFVSPDRASLSLLPKGFDVLPDAKWLEAVGFAKEEYNRSEDVLKKREACKCLGLDGSLAELVQEISSLFETEELKRLIEAQRRKKDTSFPRRSPHDPERRSDRAFENATEAAERRHEIRPRSVAKTGDEKVSARQYLKDQYTNSHSVMFCQICNVPLPFKLENGEYHFEAQPLLEELRDKLFPENFLALCPNHAAMFDLVNGSKHHLLSLVKELNWTEEHDYISVMLAGEPSCVRFTETHLRDLQAVIAAHEH